MLGKNNFKERLRKMENQDKHDRFSIRKLSIGAASVLIGFAFMTGLNAHTTLADEVTPGTSPDQQVEESSNTSSDSGKSEDANVGSANQSAANEKADESQQTQAQTQSSQADSQQENQSAQVQHDSTTQKSSLDQVQEDNKVANDVNSKSAVIPDTTNKQVQKQATEGSTNPAQVENKQNQVTLTGKTLGANASESQNEDNKGVDTSSEETTLDLSKTKAVSPVSADMLGTELFASSPTESGSVSISKMNRDGRLVDANGQDVMAMNDNVIVKATYNAGSGIFAHNQRMQITYADASKWNILDWNTGTSKTLSGTDYVVTNNGSGNFTIVNNGADA